MTLPSAATTISTTIASRSAPSPSDVRSVESFSGSIGKISAAVYTEVVFVRACSSIAERRFTGGVDVGDGDEDLHAPPVAGALTES